MSQPRATPRRWSRFARATTLLFCGLIALIPPAPLQACGSFTLDAVFTPIGHPDLPLDGFARGAIGIPRATWARSYLVVAWRALEGPPLSPEEQAGALALWEDRLKRPLWLDDPEDEVQRWLKARAAVPGLPAIKDVAIYQEEWTETSYQARMNCAPDAFNYAIRTLNARIKARGKAHPAVKAWVEAQDQVFATCANPAAPPPPSLPDTASAADKADRAYQQAAADLYAGRFAEAVQRFATIAEDAASPHQAWAPYLKARALFRQFQRGPAPEALGQANQTLVPLLRPSDPGEVARAARALSQHIQIELDPLTTLRGLADSLRKGDTGAGMREALSDYTLMLNGVLPDTPAIMLGDDQDAAKEVQKQLRDEPMTDWILTFRDEVPEAAAHALTRWKETRSPAWLLAALSLAPVAHEAVPALLEAADAWPVSHPLAPAFAYYAGQLRIKKGDLEAIRQSVARVRTAHPSVPRPTDNLLRELEAFTAPTLARLIEASWRTPVKLNQESDWGPLTEWLRSPRTRRLASFVPGAWYSGAGIMYIPPQGPTQDPRFGMFDEDGAALLNTGLPLTLLRQAVESRALPPSLRLDLTQAAWVRAILLDRPADARALAILLRSQSPALKNALNAWLNTPAGIARTRAAYALILKTPEMRPVVDWGAGRRVNATEIDNYRDNWWCAFEEAQLRPAPLLDDAQRQSLEAEWKQLTTLGAASEFLGKRVLEWSRAAPTDPAVPEALHRVVRTTRYGCPGPETGRYSQLAFQRLHKQYPDSEWTRKTPFWFDYRPEYFEEVQEESLTPAPENPPTQTPSSQ